MALQELSLTPLFYSLHIKISYGFRRLEMQQLVCNAFVLLFNGQFLQKIPVTVLIFACYLFFIVQNWVGLG